MLINKYVMNKKKYIRWMMPKFYKLPIFYIGLFMIIMGFIGIWCFRSAIEITRMQFVSIGIILMALYFMFGYNYFNIVKKYRSLINSKSINQDIDCECKVNGENLCFIVNGEPLSSFYLSDATNMILAKSYTTIFDKKGQGILFDNDGFVDRTLDDFKDYISKKFPNIKIEKIKDRFDN